MNDLEFKIFLEDMMTIREGGKTKSNKYVVKARWCVHLLFGRQPPVGPPKQGFGNFFQVDPRRSTTRTLKKWRILGPKFILAMHCQKNRVEL